VLPDRRVPLTMITVDIATLIGLLANPAYLAGHGSIDPDLAQELARNSHWQILLTEAVTLAEKLGLAVQNPETGEWEKTSDSEKDRSSTEPETGTATDEDIDAGSGPGMAGDSGAGADGIESATDSGREADFSTERNSASSPAPVPGSTSATEPAAPEAPADETDKSADAEENDESAPTPAADPTTTPNPDVADPVREHAATRATAPLADPLAEATSATGPEAAASSEPASASRSPAEQPSPAPGIARNCPESGSPTTASDSTTSGPTSADGPAPGTGATATAASDNPRQRRLGSLASAAALFCTHTPVGRGTRHSSALDLPTLNHAALNQSGLGRSGNRTGCTASGIYLGNALLAAALEAAIAADPTLGKSVPRDPLTDRALIYRPDTLTTAAVRLRDRHCRFPGCHRPAARCQLDHITPYDHTNPLGGGWTTVNNLQCLCEYHHSVKTAGYWTATMLPGGAILWTSISETTRITLPTNGTAIPILGNDLTPHIPTRPTRSGIIAYPDPPDNRQPETDDTATPPF
jgi:hypothetical protein